MIVTIIGSPMMVPQHLPQIQHLVDILHSDFGSLHVTRVPTVKNGTSIPPPFFFCFLSQEPASNGVTPISTLFQSYLGESSHIRVLPGFHQFWVRTLKCLALGHFK